MLRIKIENRPCDYGPPGHMLMTCTLDEQDGPIADQLKLLAKHPRKDEVAVLEIIDVMSEGDGEEGSYDLELALPSLETLDIQGAVVEKLVLNDALTPKLRQLCMKHQCAETGIDLQVQCGSLEDIWLEHVRINNEAQVSRMMEAALKLEEFSAECLDVWATHDPCSNAWRMPFFSTKLRRINLTQCEDIVVLAIYSPVLESLYLHRMMRLEYGFIALVDNPKEQVEGNKTLQALPKINNKTASKIDIALSNTYLPEDNIKELQENPRVRHVKLPGAFVEPWLEPFQDILERYGSVPACLQPDNLGLSERDASKFAAWLPYGHLDIIDQDNPKWFHTVDAFMLRGFKQELMKQDGFEQQVLSKSKPARPKAKAKPKRKARINPNKRRPKPNPHNPNGWVYLGKHQGWGAAHTWKPPPRKRKKARRGKAKSKAKAKGKAKAKTRG